MTGSAEVRASAAMKRRSKAELNREWTQIDANQDLKRNGEESCLHPIAPKTSPSADTVEMLPIGLLRLFA
jgi:hypothetical protein